jgi:hypothetical protein
MFGGPMSPINGLYHKDLSKGEPAILHALARWPLPDYELLPFWAVLPSQELSGYDYQRTVSATCFTPTPT